MDRPYIISCLLTLVVSFSLAQPNRSDFFAAGDAQISRENCFQLTTPNPWSAGGIWYRDSIDLREPFSMELDLMLGCEDVWGADGMVFVFSPYRAAAGYAGEGMGFAGLYPSLGIEIDTWENDHLADPIEDHVAILAHGDVSHIANLDGPNVIPNLEDCRLHRILIEWDPEGDGVLFMDIDQEEVCRYEGDLIEMLFDGNPIVYWGVTAATGRYFNRHEVCLERFDFGNPLKRLLFNRAAQMKLVRGLIHEFEDLKFQPNSTSWEEGTEGDLYRLVNLLQRNPDRHVSIDLHDMDSTDPLKTTQARAKAIDAFLQSKGISRKRFEVRAHGARYRSIDDRSRIEIHVYEPRT